MGRVRVVAGTGTGPTETAAYDAALLDAGVGNYNLVTVSSVIPPDAVVEVVGDAPDLGETGDRLTVVQARAVGAMPASVGAALAWARTDDGRGLFYEGSAVVDTDTDTDTGPDTAPGPVERALETAERGLTAGFEARGWRPAGDETVAAAAESVATSVPVRGGGRGRGPAVDPEDGVDHPQAAAVALAVYGEGSPPF